MSIEILNRSEDGVFLEKLHSRVADYYLKQFPANGPLQALRYASQSINLLVKHISSPLSENSEKYCKNVGIPITEHKTETYLLLTSEGINLVLGAEKPEDIGYVSRNWSDDQPSTHQLSEERLQIIKTVLQDER